VDESVKTEATAFIEDSDCTIDDFAFNFFYKKKFHDIASAFKPKIKSQIVSTASEEPEAYSDDQFANWISTLSREFMKIVSFEKRRGKI
jgi:hypothetical protein